ncbi:PREDICTED: uncharacterized protein LOC104814375 isoform X2 [Tarenaya hassleriana]|uniref:uncharacterized protein LOC104814375 isoform X1 n=1 Tax=Tarenaya hassleriana TaxID=28532 RepID=UPI00053C28B2|nr:PREDICTED: uncharacterized protein LOC104814375 isoform X1 [Tarenaya hassleriana]XP_010540694.1 PREDICTED: uncharacterized protein LOC104814375 isoform X2 [Tarenaya hassleriana]
MAATSLSLIPPASFFCGGNRRGCGTATGFCVARASPVDHGRESVLRLSASAVLFLGLSLHVCSPVSARILPPVVAQNSEKENKIDAENVAGEENQGDLKWFEDEGLKEEFEAYKAKVYSLTVPLKVVALRGSVPPSWIKDFMSSQGKRVKLLPKFRASLEEIFSDLSMPSKKGKIGHASMVAADIIGIGDSWLSFAIKERIIEPMKGVEGQDWYKGLSDKWKVYLRRNYDGEKAPDGEIWAVPYRWGCMVIAYKRNKFQNRKLAPIEDWADLWRPELAGRISMVNSPREIVGTVLKYMGASYNTEDMDSQVPGGRITVEKNLALLVKQVRLFDSNNYLKAFNVGDVWVAVGWSSDVIPMAKRMSNVTVIVPKSGASLWADLWVIPSVSGAETEQIGGRIRGPSPIIHQWIEFCLQPARSLPFTQEVIPGASPSAIEGDHPVRLPEDTKKNKPRLDTNLVGGIPPPEILCECEFLEPLPDDTMSNYGKLIDGVKKQEQSLGLVEKVRGIISLWIRRF